MIRFPNPCQISIHATFFIAPSSCTLIDEGGEMGSASASSGANIGESENDDMARKEGAQADYEEFFPNGILCEEVVANE